MPSQIEHAEAQRQRDELARRVQVMRDQEAELSARLAPRGWWDSRVWEAEARADQASHELARVKRERAEAELRLSALREQIGALAG